MEINIFEVSYHFNGQRFKFQKKYIFNSNQYLFTTNKKKYTQIVYLKNSLQTIINMTLQPTDPSNENLLGDILISCPKCKSKKTLQIPKKIINLSKQLTTISIPSGLCCEHSFQSFVDKNFKIRGYQNVDFEFNHMELYESSSSIDGQDNDDIKEFNASPMFQNVIQLLRNCVDDKEVLGSSILTLEGKVLYSSLPEDTLFSTIREFEVRSEKNLISVNKMYLELENNQKFISNFMEINNMRFNLILMFSFRCKFGMGNLHMRDLLKKIGKMN